MGELTEEELDLLERKLIVFIQSLKKDDSTYLKFNAQILTKIIQHHANGLGISFNTVLDHCKNMSETINIETLRKDLFASS